MHAWDAASTAARRGCGDQATHPAPAPKGPGRPGGQFEDLGIFRIISLTESPVSVERFCSDAIGALIACDRKNDSGLTKTLRVFLEYNQNRALAAKALNFHRNTLRTRQLRSAVAPVGRREVPPAGLGHEGN